MIDDLFVRTTNLRNLCRIQKAKVLAVIRRVPRDDWLVIAWVLASKLLLFLFGIKSFQILEDKYLPTGNSWLEIWNRWDSLIYQRIAQVGYDPNYVWKAWFYPLFPWSVRLAYHFCGDYLTGAFLVSGVSLFIVTLLLRRLVQLDFSAEIAQRTVWFFLIFPTAYFLHIGYTESLFLAFALGSILAARRERWWLAGVLGAGAWATRANGMILIPTLAVEAAHQYFTRRRWQWHWLWIVLVPAGFGVYLLLNLHVTGDAFAFLKMRKAVTSNSFAWPWVGIRDAVGNLHRHPNQAEMVGAQELFFVALGFACAAISWWKLRPSYSMWISATWLLFASVKFVQSAPRYALTMFPIFILFATVSANRLWNLVITMWSLLFLALFVSLFVRGWWAF